MTGCINFVCVRHFDGKVGKNVELSTFGAVHFDTGIYCERCMLSVLYLAGSITCDIER